MANRLSKITTRTGDNGSTGLADGTRVKKDNARINTISSVDELNSQIGVLLAESLAPDIRAVLLQIQNMPMNNSQDDTPPSHLPL